MNPPFFSGAVLIELQGDQPLQFIDVNDRVAQYRVNGFQQQKVIINDYRDQGLLAIGEVINTGNDSNFANLFSSPANIVASQTDNETIVFDLYNTEDSSPELILWIAIGISPSVPAYDYYYYQFEPIQESLFAFLAIYQFQPQSLPGYLSSHKVVQKNR